MRDPLDQATELAREASKRYSAVLAITTVCTAVAIWSATQLRFETDLAAMIPDDYPSVETLREVSDRIGGVGSYILLITTDDMAKAEAFAPILAEKVEAHPDISSVDYRKHIEFFRKRSLLYLPVQDVQELHHALDERIKAEKAARNPLGLDLTDDDPPPSGPTLEELVERYKAKYSDLVGRNEEYFVHPDGRSLAMLVYTRTAATDIPALRRMRDELQAIIDGSGYAAADPGMVIEITGSNATKVIEYTVMTGDVLSTALYGAGAVLLLIALFLRSGWGMLFVTVPLLMGLSWTFGMTQLLVGQLNSVTGFLFVVLFGLGIDFGIHLFSRYREARVYGLGIEDSMDFMIIDSGRALLTSTTTTSLAFFALLITDYRGFSEFGLVAGMGVIFSLVAYMLVLPAMVYVAERFGLLTFPSKPLSKETLQIERQKKVPFWRLIIVATLLLTAFGIAALLRVRFEYDMNELRSSAADTEALTRARECIPVSLLPAVLVAADDDELRAGVNALEHLANVPSTSIDRVVSLHTLVPPRQREKMVIVRRMAELLKKKFLDSMEGDAAKNLEEMRELTSIEAFGAADLPASVRAIFTGRDGNLIPIAFVYPKFDMNDVRNSTAFANEVASFYTERFVNMGGLLAELGSSAEVVAIDGRRVELKVPEEDVAETIATLSSLQFPNGAPVFEARRVVTAKDAVGGLGLGVEGGLVGNVLAIASAGAVVTARFGVPPFSDPEELHASSPEIVLSDVVNLMMRDGRVAIGFSICVVFLLLLLDFRSLSHTLLVLGPLAVAVLSMCSAMYLFDIRLNLFNLVIIPTVVGMGIDYSVHIFHRYKHEGRGSAVRAVKHVGTTVAAAAITTIAGFASLLFASHPGMRSLGLLAVIGLGAGLIASTIVLPGLLEFSERWESWRDSRLHRMRVHPSHPPLVVTIYSTTYDPTSKIVMNFLEHYEVKYEHIEVDTLEDAVREEVFVTLRAKLGHNVALPVIDCDGKLLEGFNARQLRRALRLRETQTKEE